MDVTNQLIYSLGVVNLSVTKATWSKLESKCKSHPWSSADKELVGK